MAQLITDWLKVAESGRAFDGRNIEAQWLKDMAASYDRSRYTALIWPEHERWFENYGEVMELEAREAGEATELWAKLAPNSFYFWANQMGQKLFYSIEVDFDIVEEGQAYLGGLAATDSPASLGMLPTHFKKDSKSQWFSSRENASIPKKALPDPKADYSGKMEPKGFLSALKQEIKEFKDFIKKFTATNEGKESMEPWEEAINALREEFNGKLDAMDGRITELEGNSGENLNDENEDLNEEDKEKSGENLNEEDEEDEEEKEKEELSKKLDEALSKLSKMEKRFAAAKPGTNTPENLGKHGDLAPLI